MANNKPDERLLTDEEIQKAIYDTGGMSYITSKWLKESKGQDRLQRILKAQLAKDLEWEAKTASIIQAERLDGPDREKQRANIHAVVSKGCRLCDYWDSENYHCMLNVPIHPAYPCNLADQLLALIPDKDAEIRGIFGLVRRFWAKVKISPNSGCWEWRGSRNQKGYGQFWDGKRLIPSHRFAYELLMRSVPDGQELDHLCRNTRCVNPLHLEIVNRSENTLRGNGPELVRQRQMAKSNCPQGHTYDSENTYINSKGQRSCEICRREARKRWKVRNRQTLKSRVLKEVK